MLGGSELLIIGGAAAFFLFGPKLLRNLGTSAAESIREFRKIKTELETPLELSPKVKAKEGN